MKIYQFLLFASIFLKNSYSHTEGGGGGGVLPSLSRMENS